MKKTEYGKIVGKYMLDKIISSISPKMALKRKSKYGTITRISPEVRYRECDISSYLNHEKYNDVIIRVQQVLEKELSHCNNNAFYENIRTLFISEYETAEDVRKQFNKEIDAAGTYGYNNENRIGIHKYNMPYYENYPYELFLQDITAHELLHMATTYKKGVILMCGFHQSTKNTNHIGMGLNEGYTELLNERYFSHVFPTVSYVHQKGIAMGIEEIVGQKKMEQLYFDADLNGLIEELSRYISKEEAINLIREIDECNSIERKDFVDYFNKAMNLKAKIARIQSIKNKQLFASGKITLEEFEFYELKSTFYKVGEILDKTPTGYKFRYYDNHDAKTLSNQAYKILKNTAKQEDNASNLAICAHKLHNAEFRDNIDLTNIETIELSYEAEKGYRLVEKKDKEKSDTELASMLLDDELITPDILSKKTKS